MPTQPELPRPAHIDHESMLSRKFGKEVTNYFGSKIRCRKSQWIVLLIVDRFTFESSFISPTWSFFPLAGFRSRHHEVHGFQEFVPSYQNILRDIICLIQWLEVSNTNEPFREIRGERDQGVWFAKKDPSIGLSRFRRKSEGRTKLQKLYRSASFRVWYHTSCAVWRSCKWCDCRDGEERVDFCWRNESNGLPCWCW